MDRSREWKDGQHALPELERLLEAAGDDGSPEELVYRFYHHSWKVYPIQELTSAIVEALRELSPTARMTRMFEEIVAAALLELYDIR